MLIEINYSVMPGLMRGHPEILAAIFLNSGSMAGMTSRSATIKNRLRLKARDLHHPRKRH
jgi:hypothetical protein